MRNILLYIVISLASLVTAASVQRSKGALIIIDDNDFVYIPSAETDNPAHHVFDEPKPISKAVVAASPLRYEEISGTGLYKCLLYFPDMGRPSSGIYEMRGSKFEVLQFSLDVEVFEQSFASGVICYILPGVVKEGKAGKAEEEEDKQEERKKDHIALWVNGQEQGDIGKMVFVEKLNEGEGENNRNYEETDVTIFDGGPQALTDAYIMDWTGRDEHLPFDERGDVSQPFCRLIEENGRYAGFTSNEPLEDISGTFIGIVCE